MQEMTKYEEFSNHLRRILQIIKLWWFGSKDLSDETNLDVLIEYNMETSESYYCLMC